MYELLEVNQTTMYQDVRLKAKRVPEYNCSNCFFDGKKENDVNICSYVKCRSVERPDRNNIILVEVK